MMETSVFPKPAVAGELKRFVEARLHTDHGGNAALNESQRALQLKLVGVKSLPSYAIVEPATGKVEATFEGGVIGGDPARFVEFLRRANS